jgi:hypothetical protein
MAPPTKTEQAVARLLALRNRLPAGDAEPEEIAAFLAELGAAAGLFNQDDNKPDGAATSRISICPWEVQYETAAHARTHLERVQKAQNSIGEAGEFTNAELEAVVQESGKLNVAMNKYFRRTGINLFIIFSTAPYINFAATDKDGWFDDPTLSRAQKESMWRRHEVPGHIIAVKVEKEVVSGLAMHQLSHAMQYANKYADHRL